MQRKAEERRSSSGCLHATSSSSDFVVSSSLTPLFLIHLLEDFSPLPSSPKWLCQNGGNRQHLLYFSYILTFYIYNFFQFYTCSRFIASLLCLIKSWSWLSQAIVTSKSTDRPSYPVWLERRDLPLFRWRNNDYLILSPRLHLMSLKQLHHQNALTCLFRCNKQTCRGWTSFNFKQLDSRQGVMTPGRMPVPLAQYAQIRG